MNGCSAHLEKNEKRKKNHILRISREFCLFLAKHYRNYEKKKKIFLKLSSGKKVYISTISCEFCLVFEE